MFRRQKPKIFEYFVFLKLSGELIEVIVATLGEVGLQNFSKQTPFQQVVCHGEKLLDNLMEIL